MLMLRGPQTVGELRGRTERMYEFTELADVEHCLRISSHPRARAAGSPHAPRPLDPPARRHPRSHAEEPVSAAPTPASDVENRLATLEREVADLKQMLESFRRQFE